MRRISLAIASGSGAIARRVVGSCVIGGMLAATCIAVLLIPVTFYLMERLGGAKVDGRHVQRSQDSQEGGAPNA